MSARKVITVLALIPTLALAACSPVAAITGAITQSQNSSLVQPVAASSSQASAQLALNKPSSVTSASSSTTGDLAATEATYESVYQAVSPSVVEINVVEGATTASSSSGSFGRTNPFGNGSNPFSNGAAQATQALGSGVIWDTQGHIVTNNHVVSGASSITVTFSDGTTLDAKLVGADPNADLAVIQVNAPASLLVPIKLADTSTVKVGEIAIAIGNPYGLNNTMTTGIISGLERSLPTGLDNTTTQSGPTYNIPDIIQTDASINPGNSGGALVDISGNLIGITAAIESSSGSNSGIGFVIPSEIVQKVAPSLISTGSYNHPYLGIAGTDMTASIASAMGLSTNTRGALVETVSAGGPAAKAGLQASTQQAVIDGQQTTVGGDVITAIDGQPVQTFSDLGSYLFLHTDAGQAVTLTILRGGKTLTVQVTTGIAPQQ
jgi:S1-C subfamily serine protease